MNIPEDFKAFMEAEGRDLTYEQIAKHYGASPSSVVRWAQMLGISKPRRRINILGQRFGRVVVIEQSHDKDVRCQCDCGKQFWTCKYNLIHGNTRSCGCLRDEINGARLHKAAQLDQNERILVESIRNAKEVKISTGSLEITLGGRVPHDVALAVQSFIKESHKKTRK